MPERIERENFEKYEALILSGQIAQEDVPRLLQDNGAFDTWYRQRMRERRSEAAR
jgi:hypothetical protein